METHEFLGLVRDLSSAYFRIAVVLGIICLLLGSIFDPALGHPSLLGSLFGLGG